MTRRQDTLLHSERPLTFSTGTRGSLSVFFPAYNDADSLRTLIPKMVETLRDLSDDFEVIVVDDGSTDATPQVLKALQEKFSCLRVVRHVRNLGYGGALQSGFRAATRELIFYTDGDGQYDVRELAKLLAALSPEVDVVNGYKIRRADSVGRNLIGKLYHYIVRTLFRLRVRDVDCDFRLIRRHVIDGLRLTSRSGAICAELMAQIERAQFRVVEVPVHHYPRLSGRSRFFRAGPVARTVCDILRLWIRSILMKGGPRAARTRRDVARPVEDPGAHGAD